MSLNRLRSVKSTEILDKIKGFIDHISQINQVTAIIIFGSLALDKMTEESDIDIAVLVEDESDQKELRQKIATLKRSYCSWPMDLVVLKKSWFEKRSTYGGLCMEINATGKWLYLKKEGVNGDES